MSRITIDRVVAALLAYWRGEQTLPLQERNLCHRLAARLLQHPSVDGGVRAQPDQHIDSVRSSLEQLYAADPIVRAWCATLLRSANDVAATITVIGNGNITAGRDIVVGTHRNEQPHNQPAPRLSPTSITLTLRFVAFETKLHITWEAETLGSYTSSFELPYKAEMLKLVLRALDVVQFADPSEHASFFAQPDIALLSRAGLWEQQRIPRNLSRLIGQRFFQALTADPAAEHALALAQNYAAANQLPIEYALRLPPEASELLAMPWELLWDAQSPLLVRSGSLASCVRYLNLPQPLPPRLLPSLQLRVLSVTPQAELDAGTRAQERSARLRALDKLTQDGKVVLEELTPATFERLVERLQTRPSVDILHFYGHGRVGPDVGELLFDSEHDGMRWVSADRLAIMMRNVRLVSLHACHSNATDLAAPLTGVAAHLLKANVPAVIAMQCSVRSDAAARFSAVVYRSLLSGESLQTAVAQARQALYAEEPDQASWFVPTLSIRALTGEPMHFLDIGAASKSAF